MEKICSLCGKKIKGKAHKTRNGKLVCGKCWEKEWETPTKLLHFRTDRRIGITILTEHFGSLDDLPIRKVKRVKISTDDLTFYDDWSVRKGYETIGDGWINLWDDDFLPEKQRIKNFFHDLETGKIASPINIWWVFGYTSNVFAVSTKLIIRKKDKKEFIRWLELNNENLKELREAFE